MHISERSQLEKTTYCVIYNHETFRRDKIMEPVQSQWSIAVERGEEGINTAQRIMLRAMKLLLYDTNVVATCYYTSVKSIVSQEANHNVHCGLWMTMMYQCRFISCSKCTHRYGMLIVREAVCFMWGCRVVNSELSSYSVNLKLL